VRGQVFAQGAELSEAHINVTDTDKVVSTIDLTGARIDDLHFSGRLAKKRPNIIVNGLKIGRINARLTGESKEVGHLSKYDAWRFFIWCSLAVFAVWASKGETLPLCLGIVYLLALAAALLRGRRWIAPCSRYLRRRPVAVIVRGILSRSCAFLSGRPVRKWPQQRHRPILFLLDCVVFDQGFFAQIERLYRNDGDDATADEVFLKRRRKECDKTHGMPRWWRKFTDFAYGYGVRVPRLVNIFLLLFIANVGIFSEPLSVEHPLGFGARLATQPIVIASDRQSDSTVSPATTTPRWQTTQPSSTGYVNPYQSDGGAPDQWRSWNALFVALRLQIPVVNLMAEADWEPSSREFFGIPLTSVPVTYQQYGSIVSLLNLILLPMIIAGLTGVLKRP
jgi:hypothetical protein